MRQLPFLAQRLFNRPLAIEASRAELVMAALADHFGVSKLFRAGGHEVALEALALQGAATERAEERAYDVVAGIAVIPVVGTLVAKSGSLRPVCGITGYDGIRMNLMAALSDPSVRAIMFDLDSGGGEVSGCFDLCDTVYAARGLKPMWAVLNDMACSAAYAIASAADYITVPRTGTTGSVGVICMHTDMSKALDKQGVAVTIIQYGARKSDGSDAKPLSDEALARFQGDVDTMGNLFVETVARNRGMGAAKVRKTEAATFLGASGVSVGFADAVMAPDEAFRRLLSQLG